MVLKRLMPCLLYNGKGLVKTIQFSSPQYVGDPINAIKIYNEKEVDELIFLDINASVEKRSPNFEKIAEIASECFMPLTYGGGVSKMDDFIKLFSIGVEKIALNTLLLSNPNLVKEAIAKFGSQAIVGVIDCRDEMPYNKTGNIIKYSLEEYIIYLQDELKVGEILFQNVNREGTWKGYDHQLIKKIIAICKVPLIVLGGASDTEDIKSVLYTTGANAAAIGSMAVFQKKDMGVLIKFPKREKIITE